MQLLLTEVTLHHARVYVGVPSSSFVKKYAALKKGGRFVPETNSILVGAKLLNAQRHVGEYIIQLTLSASRAWKILKIASVINLLTMSWHTLPSRRLFVHHYLGTHPFKILHVFGS